MRFLRPVLLSALLCGGIAQAQTLAVSKAAYASGTYTIVSSFTPAVTLSGVIDANGNAIIALPIAGNYLLTINGASSASLPRLQASFYASVGYRDISSLLAAIPGVTADGPVAGTAAATSSQITAAQIAAAAAATAANAAAQNAQAALNGAEAAVDAAATAAATANLIPRGGVIASQLATTGADSIYGYARVHGNGVANSFANCTTGKPCFVTIDPGYTGTETEQQSAVGGLYAWDKTYQPGTRSVDLRAGRRTEYASDIGTVDSLDGAGTNVVTIHLTDPVSAAVAGQTSHQINLNLGFLSMASGSGAYGGETNVVGLNNTVVCGTVSICQGMHTIIDGTKGEADLGGDYLEMNYWGGSFNGDDEGGVARSTAMWDGLKYGNVPMGRVTGVNPDGSVTMSVASLDGYTRSFGEGRYAVRLQAGGADAALYSVHAATQGAPSQTGGPHGHGAYGTVSFDPSETALPISTAWGQATTYTQIAATNDTPTAMQITATIDGPGAFKNGVACWEGGHRSGQGTISNAQAVANGIQAFTLSLYEDPDGNSAQGSFYPYVFQGGLCGTIARPAFYDEGVGNSNQALPFIGSIDAHTGVTGIHYRNGLANVPGFIGSTSASATNLRAASLYKFYSAARIVGLKNPAEIAASSAGHLGDYLALEPHAWTPSVGDLIDSPVTYSTMMKLDEEVVIAHLPGTVMGHDEVLQGQGIDASYTHRKLTNANPYTMYAPFGGLLSPPSVESISGLFGGYSNINMPAPGMRMFSVGCSPLGCADPTSYHTLYTAYATGGVYDEYFQGFANRVVKGWRNGETISITLGGGIQLDSAGNGVDFVNAPLLRVATATLDTSGTNRGDIKALIAAAVPNITYTTVRTANNGDPDITAQEFGPGTSGTAVKLPAIGNETLLWNANHVARLRPDGSISQLTDASGQGAPLGIPTFGTPASSSDPCTPPQVKYDGTNTYWCVASGKWKEVPLNAF